MDQYSESTVPMSSSVPSKTETVSASSQSADPTATTVVSSSTSNSSPSSKQNSAQTSGSFDRSHPIPPASEPMQYRAIGLVRAIYKPSEEQFTRGELIHENGCSFGAVLLGRVMSLVKKHIDLDQPHLWVVYPRTRQKHNELHLQIVGVWEPETLNRADDEQSSEASDADASGESDSLMAEEPEELVTEAEPSEPSSELDSAGQTLDAPAEAIATEAVPPESESGLTPPKKPVPPKPPTPPATAEPETPPALPDVDDGYFSIRGEIVHYTAQAEQVTVKIEQASRRPDAQAKHFKLTLNGALEGRTLYHFWDLYVRLQDNELVIQDGQRIGVVRPKQPPKGIKSKRINKIHKKGSKPKGTKFGSSAPVKESDANDEAVKPLESTATVAGQPTSTEVAPQPTSDAPDPSPVVESTASPEEDAVATPGVEAVEAAKPVVESEPATVTPVAEPEVPADPISEPAADSADTSAVAVSTGSEPVEAKADPGSDVETAPPDSPVGEVDEPVAEMEATPEVEPVAEEPAAEEPMSKKAKKSGKVQSKSKKSSS